MQDYRVQGKFSGDYTIRGDNLIDAIKRDLADGVKGKMCRDAQFGNAAGHRKLRAHLEYSSKPTDGGYYAGKDYYTLTVEAIGLDLAHKKNDEPARTHVFTIFAPAGECPDGPVELI